MSIQQKIKAAQKRVEAASPEDKGSAQDLARLANGVGFKQAKPVNLSSLGWCVYIGTDPLDNMDWQALLGLSDSWEETASGEFSLHAVNDKFYLVFD